MVKGRDVSNMNRIITSENSTIILHFYASGRILICTISDPDDDNGEIIDVIKRVGMRFWSRYQHQIEAFRLGGEKPIFNGYDYELDTLFLGGKIAYHLPQLITNPVSLDQVHKIGVINDLRVLKLRISAMGKFKNTKIRKKISSSQCFQIRK